ncbi:vacuolar protein sorting-associated protein 37C isoform X2 [Protopterus annectens]|uniref:vacuolar protein sorting-associated protein 37C isoform X2 n=1 Tax=Protopterus annectens TaxID=7888 RepID=UPI001CFA1B95|nr:vacuolar protein sorting-associated protein 37C isoform X2 [Protopterus annectens]
MADLDGMGNKLKELSDVELQDMLDDPEKLADLINDLPELQNVQLEKEMAFATNRSLAEKNLEFKPQLENGKTQLSEKYQQLQLLSNKCQEQKEKLGKLATSYKPDQLLSLLQIECANSDEVSESTAEAFLAGEVPLESFLEDFPHKRRLAHLQRIQLEKLEELMSRMSNGTGNPADQITHPQSTTTQTTASVPSLKPAFPLPYSSAPGSSDQKPMTDQSPYRQLPSASYPQLPSAAPLPYQVPYCASPSLPTVSVPYGMPQQQPSFMPSGNQPPYPFPSQPQFPSSRLPGQPPYPVQPQVSGGIGLSQPPYPAYPMGPYFTPFQPTPNQPPAAMYRPGYNMPRPYS